MNSIKNLSLLCGLFLLASCGASKMTFESPLTSDNQKKIYDVCSYSKTFGQVETTTQTDTPYHLYMQSGFYEKDHFSISVTAHEKKRGDGFYVTVRASGGDDFVKNVSKQQRKDFLLELKTAIVGDQPADSTLTSFVH